MFYFILKVIFKIALRIFFQKIEVKNRHLIPAEGPLLIASNHPNTFMDPIAIAAITRQEIYFIAKATFFNSSVTSWLLHKMNLIPVYRREDGPRTAPDLPSLWNVLDLTPEGRGTDWYPKLQY